MTILNSELYDALLEGGTSDAKARAAAQSMAAYDDRFARIEHDIALLRWMVGTNVILTIAILVKLFVH